MKNDEQNKKEKIAAAIEKMLDCNDDYFVLKKAFLNTAESLTFDKELQASFISSAESILKNYRSKK